MATSIDDNAADEKSDKSIWRLLNIHCTNVTYDFIINPCSDGIDKEIDQSKNGYRKTDAQAKKFYIVG